MKVWKELARAREVLASGGVVGMPTETVYGLAGAVNRPEAIRSIFTTKERPFFDPLIVHVARMCDVESVAESFPAAAQALCRHFWPGPLTVILPKRPDLDPTITAGLDTVAVRMPRHPLALRLIRRVGSPLAAPSANRFGKTSPTSAGDVRQEFDRSVFVVDGGPCEVGLESTVVDAADGGNQVVLTILRPGVITEDQLMLALRGQGVSVTKAQSAKSPGHLEQHYQPEIPLVIVPGELFPLSEETCRRAAQELKLTDCRYAELELEPEAVIAARKLYRRLRDLSRAELGFIVVKKDPAMTGGAWEAVWDRIGRAASLKL